MQDTPIQIASCVVLDDYGRMLLVHRHRGELGYWELPGAEVPEEELPETIAVRSVQEILAVQVTLTRLLASDTYEEDEQAYQIHWFQATIKDGLVQSVASELFDDFDYVGLEDLPSLAVSGALLRLQEKLLLGEVVLEQ